MIKYIILAQAATCDANSPVLCNPTNAGDITQFMAKLLVTAGAIIGILTIVMVVYSGFRMIISQGDTEAVTKAKSAFRWSISGLLLTLFAFIIVNAVGAFFQSRPGISPNPGNVQNPITSPDVFALTRAVLTNFLNVVGLLAILFIIINGFRYITARGNDEQTEQAKQGLLWAIIGLIIVLLAYVIVYATANFFK